MVPHTSPTDTTDYALLRSVPVLRVKYLNWASCLIWKLNYPIQMVAS